MHTMQAEIDDVLAQAKNSEEKAKKGRRVFVTKYSSLKAKNTSIYKEPSTHKTLSPLKK